MIDVTFTDQDGNDPARSIIVYIRGVMPNQDDMQKAGDWLVAKRRQETLAGQDIDGASFAPYSPAYAFRTGHSNVTLYSSKQRGEHMIDALKAIATTETDGTTSLEVGIFGDAELAERARIQNEGGLVRTRFGYGNGGFKTPLGVGRRQPKGKKTFATIPSRRWIGASDADIQTMQEIIVESAQERVEKEQTGNG